MYLFVYDLFWLKKFITKFKLQMNFIYVPTIKLFDTGARFVSYNGNVPQDFRIELRETMAKASLTHIGL